MMNKAAFIFAITLAASSVLPSLGHASEPETEQVRVCFDSGNGQLTGASFTREVRDPSPFEIDEARRTVERVADLNRSGSGITTLIDNGRSDKRTDIVFVGDGYTASELDQYHADVDALVASIFAYEPFRSYRSRFNVHRVDVVSNESGVDNDPTLGIERDTALDMGFWCNDIERALCADSTKARAFAALAPDDDHVIAVANSTKFGGAAFFGTQIACVAARSSLASSTVRHELGHSMFTLEDEYNYGGPTSYNGPEFGRTNISIFDEAEQVERKTKWWQWMGRTVEGFDGPVGAYEGARYSRAGIFRSSPNSLMRSHNREFNPPSIEQALVAIHSTDDPWTLFENGTQPIGGTFVGHDHVFEIQPNHPTSHDLTVWWQLGNEVIEVEGNSVHLCELQLQPGQYTLVAKVRDDTPWVVSDWIREQSLTSNFYWFIRIETPPADRNADGVISVADLIDFIQDFTAGDDSADLAMPRNVLDLQDIIEFVERFNQLCG